MDSIETQILNLAAKHGLHADKRITTGSPNAGHFATFEIWGDVIELPVGRFRDLFLEFFDGGRSMVKLRIVNVQGHPQYGKPYIEIESIWCERPARQTTQEILERDA